MIAAPTPDPIPVRLTADEHAFMAAMNRASHAVGDARKRLLERAGEPPAELGPNVVLGED